MSEASKAAREIADALLAWARAIGHVMPLPTTFDEVNERIISRAIESSQRPYVEWLQKYADHAPQCKFEPYYEYDGISVKGVTCTCGLDELRKQVGGE